MSPSPVHLVVFYCDGGSLATPPADPVLPGVGFIRVPCIGRVDTGTLLRPLRLGAAGVLLAGCEADGCRFLRGEDVAEQAATRASLALGTLGLDPTRIGLARAGRGPALISAVESFLQELGARPTTRSRRSAECFIDAFPPTAFWPHHGVVQEAAALSTRPDATPARVPIWADSASARVGRADTLLFACDLPVLPDVLGEPFGVRTLDTLEAALRLVRFTGETIGVWPGPNCGHDFGMAGLTTPFAAAAARFRRALRDTDASRLVVVGPECGFTLANIYPTLGVSLGVEVLGLATWLHDHRQALPLQSGRDERVALLVEGPPSSLPARRRRALDLLAVAGVDPVAVLPDTRRAQPARGSAGVNGFLRCDQAARNAQDQLLHTAERAGADVLLTTSTHASVHLGCAVRRGGWRRTRVQVTTLFDFLADCLPGGGEA